MIEFSRALNRKALNGGIVFTPMRFRIFSRTCPSWDRWRCPSLYSMRYYCINSMLLNDRLLSGTR